MSTDATTRPIVWAEELPAAGTESVAERARRRDAQHRVAEVSRERQSAAARSTASIVAVIAAFVVLVAAVAGVVAYRHHEAKVRAGRCIAESVDAGFAGVSPYQFDVLHPECAPA